MTSVRILLLALACGLALAQCPPARAQAVALAADRPGTTFNTVGSAIATVAGKHAGLNVIVRPYAGPAAWAPIVDSGEVALGVMSANSAYQAFTGDNEQKTAFHNLRLVRAGGASLMLGFLVRNNGPIKTYADLKGKRISSEFGGHLSIKSSLLASLKIAGYTWNDVTAVPVTGANDGIDALVANRLDASWASLGQPRAREADTQIGVRYLAVPDTPEAEKIYQQLLFPGARIAVAEAGAVPGVVGPTRLLSYDAYVVAGKDVPDAVIAKLLDGLWKGTEELFPVHPSLRGFTHEASVTSAPVIPYHPAAVAFYKQKGLWTEAVQARQDELLADAGK
ncbi:MAG: TAXI family TRAP transporter solute-binding subunit [Hyphomicrobiaceae bacterium]|nr:TAXI family TRAP transporter solute-binding subunit [Hyphomicrobiaceae bacterium]